MNLFRFRMYPALFFLLFLSCSREDNPAVPDNNLPIRGFDASVLPEIRHSGISLYNQAGHAEDMLQTLRNSGANLIRLRLWTGGGGFNSNFQTVKSLAAECKALGMSVLLSVHYSDTWADPANQSKPVAWNNLNIDELKDTVYGYTKKIVMEIAPDMIQIGNEINNGFLWPDGSIGNLVQMKSLIQSAIAAVRDVRPATRILLHFAGHDNALAFYNDMSGLDYDVVALSYYPNWHGKNLQHLSQSLQALSAGLNKDIMIVETAYPFTLDWNDFTNNIIGLNSQILDAYPPTPQGQKDFLRRISDIIKAAPRGIGFCYWGGEWVSCHGDTSTLGSPWENQALWDFDNRVLPALDVY